MSDALMEVLAFLPTPCKQRAIISCIASFLASGEWEMADQILSKLLKIGGHKLLKAEALSLGVVIAVRAGNHNLALERYQYLASAFQGADCSLFTAKALFHLSDILLPVHPTQLSEYLQKLVASKLSPEGQKICAKIALILVRQFHKNSDIHSIQRTIKSVQKYLDPKYCKTEFENMNAYEE